jgi:tRNA dimethylallyltransferase
MKNKINIIFGTTASGKTKLGIELAKKLDGIVINYDSMQVYKEIPIISAQPTKEEQDGVAHLLFGYVSCVESYSVGRWLDDAIPLIKKTLSENKTPILVGGTGMYVKNLIDGMPKIPEISTKTKAVVAEWKKALTSLELHEKLYELDPITANQLNPNDSQRIQRALKVVIDTGKSLSAWQKQNESVFPRDLFHIIKIEKPREQIYKNIDLRFIQMIEAGAVDEVSKLYNKFGNSEYPRACGLYELISYLNGDITLQEAISKSQQISRNYAKRQATWMNHQIEADKVINYG